MVSIPKRAPSLVQRSASTECSDNSSCESWDASLQHLSESLNQICSSPTQSRGGSFHDFMKNRSASLNQEDRRSASLNHSPASLNQQLASLNHGSGSLKQSSGSLNQRDGEDDKLDGSGSSTDVFSQSFNAFFSSSLNDKSSSDHQVVFLQLGRKCKRVRVRHEESRRKLQEQLAAICSGGKSSEQSQRSFRQSLYHNGQSSLDGSTTRNNNNNNATAGKIVPHRPDINRDALKEVFRLKVPLGDVIPEQLCIQATEETLSVYTYQKDAPQQQCIQNAEITTDVDVGSLMCIIDDGVLDIKQYPQKYLTVECSPPQCSTPGLSSSLPLYLPIMQQDDGAGTWRMILHVPGCYDATAMPSSTSRGFNVKTLDDRLIISWNIVGPENRVTNNKVSLALPYNVTTRSVSGVVTEDNQLIIEAQLGRKRNRCLTF